MAHGIDLNRSLDRNECQRGEYKKSVTECWRKDLQNEIVILIQCVGQQHITMIIRRGGRYEATKPLIFLCTGNQRKAV